MDKAELLRRIIAQLTHDLGVLFSAAKTAHEAATHAENIPDNKYDTLALEASYVAQGQANRAHEIRRALAAYRELAPAPAGDDVVRLASLVTLEAADGTLKTVFIGPLEGGLKITEGQTEIVVITPGSPLGREMMGKMTGDEVEIRMGSGLTAFQIVEIC